MNLYSLFKPLVFAYLDTISNGTNKKAIEQLLTPKSVAYTFELPIKLSNKLFKKWQQKNTQEKN